MAAESARDVDLLIIGAGPVGLFGAYYAGVRGLSMVVLDALEEVGGQITAMYPEKTIFDVAGFPAIRGRDLVAALVEQAAPHDPEYLLGHTAVGLEPDSGRDSERGSEADSAGGESPDNSGIFRVTTDRGAVINARAVLIAAGIGQFTPRPLPAGGDYAGRGLVHFVTDPATLAGQHVVVVGGGDSAVDWALLAEPIAQSVTLVHRREEFRAHPHSVALLGNSRVRILTTAQIAAVRGQPVITEVDVDVKGELVHLRCDKLVAALGFTANLGALADWGLRIDKRSVLVDSAGRTNIAGIYAAGDIADYPGKVKLIVSGFGEAATAVNNIAAYLDPHVSAFPGHLSGYGA